METELRLLISLTGPSQPLLVGTVLVHLSLKYVPRPAVSMVLRLLLRRNYTELFINYQPKSCLNLMYTLKKLLQTVIKTIISICKLFFKPAVPKLGGAPPWGGVEKVQGGRDTQMK
ncbi:hypothetical protein J6590_057319 [Homalodisca vitripennis]|nr:hypothetical protein J6590_057319 [Homalodisca vitripennis]